MLGAWQQSTKSKNGEYHIAMTVDVHLALVNTCEQREGALGQSQASSTSNRATRGDGAAKNGSIVRTLESLQAYFARMHALTDFDCVRLQAR
jgi:hypothetical protein